jgi:hypothetical protein
MPESHTSLPQRPDGAAQQFLKWLVIAAKWTGRLLRRIGIALLVFGRALYDTEFAGTFNRTFKQGAGALIPQPALPEPVPAVKAAPVPVLVPPATLDQAPPDSALLLLGLFQKEARLVDFLQQEVATYSDQQVGAAARVVHEGLRRVLHETLTIAPIRTEPEGGRVTLEAGFDSAAIRITGQLVGAPPFRGTLVHAGWRATDLRLPKVASGRDLSILAPAEVEL